MIKACFIVKYPPIQGGVSMLSYWLARQLAERGHQIDVVTNAMEVEDDYRMYLDEDDREWYEPRSTASGGFVRVHHTQPLSPSLTHIPTANPYVTKLSSLATQVVRRHDCDVVFAYYLQPYGLAAHLVSHWTGVPYMVRHAGSDLGRLMRQPGLTTAYREVVKGADAVWTSPSMTNTFLALGVPEEDIWFGPALELPAIFNPTAPPLDLNALLRKLTSVRAEHVRSLLINTKPIDPATPTIGIYGKVGEVKGSFDLLNALALLKRKGLAFNLVALTQGTSLPGFKQMIHEFDLQDRSWILPFLPHWRVPGFLRACTAVCFLEREFPITFHTPTIAREVLASGTCLILSSEIAAKQASLRTGFIDGQNLLLVEDPRDHADLARQLQIAIENPDRAARIGLNGAELYRERHAVPASEPTRPAIEFFEEQLLKVGDRKQVKRRRTAAPDGTARNERLRARLSWTSALLSGSWDGLVNRYCQAHVVAAGNQFADAVSLCEFLESQLADQNGAAGPVRDALRYEKHHNLLYVDEDGWPQSGSARTEAAAGGNGTRAGRTPTRSSARRRSIRFQGRPVDEVLNLRPVKAPNVCVEVFDRDFKALVKALRQGDSPHEAQGAQTIILFKKELNFVGVELKINEATRFYLDLCDGRRTVKATIAAMGDFYQRTAAPIGEAEVTHAVIEVLRELTGKEIVRLLGER